MRVEQPQQSRIGKRPVVLPAGVTSSIKEGIISIKGPKGQVSRKLPPNVHVKLEGDVICVEPSTIGREGVQYQGLTRALIQGMLVGAESGYTKTLQLVGTGYRAELKGQTLRLSLGFSHPILFSLPDDIKAEVPSDSKGTVIILTGSDKEKIGQKASEIRSFRPPEPYGGKGVRYQGEKIRQKMGKAGKGK